MSEPILREEPAIGTVAHLEDDTEWTLVPSLAEERRRIWRSDTCVAGERWAHISEHAVRFSLPDGTTVGNPAALAVPRAEARLRRMAEERYPSKHVGYSQPVPRDCRCDECHAREMQREAFIEGATAGAALHVELLAGTYQAAAFPNAVHLGAGRGESLVISVPDWLRASAERIAAGRN